MFLNHIFNLDAGGTKAEKYLSGDLEILYIWSTYHYCSIVFIITHVCACKH